jgi:hypothetical protein
MTVQDSGPGIDPQISSEYLTAFSLQRLTGWEWDSRFVGQLLKPTMVAFGQKREFIKARFFGFHYRATLNCLLLAPNGHHKAEKTIPSANCAKSNFLNMNLCCTRVLSARPSFRDWNVQGSIDLDRR